MERTWRRGEYELSTDRRRVDVDLVHDFLARHSYWARGIPRAVVERSLEHSVVMGLYGPDGQAGFARAVTDHATFAWLGDVFVVDAARGRGLGTWLVETLVGLPELAGLRRWMLATADAHDLYRRFGFAEPAPGILLERVDREVYTRAR